jgi:hypothetical protein
MIHIQKLLSDRLAWSVQAIPLNVDGKISPFLEDVKVVPAQGSQRKRIIWTIFGFMSLLCRGISLPEVS